MNIFKTFQYRVVTDTLREILDGPYKGYTLSSKGNLYDKNNKIVTINSTKHHPTRYIATEGFTIILWRLMCYIWLDDLTDFEATTVEQEYISNYKLVKRFWTKYSYLIPTVYYRDIKTDYIPLPRLMGFNLKTGKIVRMKIKTRAIFALGDLSIPTVIADFKALISNKDIEIHKDNTDKIENIVKLATKYKELSEQRNVITVQITALTAKQKELADKMDKIKTNLSSILK